MSILVGSMLSSCTTTSKNSMNAVIEKGLERSVEQAKYLATSLADEPELLPRSAEADGTLITSDSHWWCSGFFSGVLWMLYNDTKEEVLKDYAINYTDRIEKEQYSLDTHDLGFMMYCSYGHAYRITGDAKYKNVILQSSKSLASRYKEETGVIRSWDHSTDKWQYPVIIDNLMNLEMLEEAYKLSNNKLFDHIARSHADRSMLNHFRPDFSSCHVVDYDSITGKVLSICTHQGYADASSWSRGQAWGLYGYTSCYRESKDVQFLRQAENIASLIMRRVKTEDAVPLWDYDAPDTPQTPRDASAAAITASALIELSTLVEDGQAYMEYAGKLLKSLSSDGYLAKPGTNRGFILMHSTGSLPNGSEIDTPLNYADYYYLEALLRYMQVKEIDYKHI